MDRSPYTAERELIRSTLKRLREESGMSQGELARRLDVPQSLVSRFENGDRKLDLQELREVCQAIGVPLKELVGRFERALTELSKP